MRFKSFPFKDKTVVVIAHRLSTIRKADQIIVMQNGMIVEVGNHKNQRTEEVQDIIDRMPHKFGRYTSYIIIFIVVLLFFFGFIIKYPDIVTGKITINNASQSVKLVANSTGKIHLFSKKFPSEVAENEPIAYIQNTVSYDSITKIKNLLSDFLTLPKYTAVLDKLPNKITFGELSSFLP